MLAAFEHDVKDCQKYWEGQGLSFRKANNCGNSTINLIQVMYLTVLARNEMLFKYIIQNHVGPLRTLDANLPDMASNIHSLYFQADPPPLMSLFEGFSNLI